jgi:hypothetical protein
MKLILRSIAVLGAFMLLAQTVPARADDVSDLQAKMRAALRSAKSFVETVTVSPNPYVPLGGTMVFTVVAPNRYRQLAGGGSMPPDETVIIGNEVYGNDSRGWTVQTWSDHLVTGFEGDVFNLIVRSIGADATVAGKMVGSVVLKDPRGAKESDVLACTYEKSSFRLLTCSGGSSKLVVSKYDDPANAIPTPKNPKRLDK